MKVAIVVLNWNGASLLKKLLPRIIEHSKGAQVYVIDNGSTDESIGVLSSEFKDVHLVQLNKNYGFTGGYNIGLKEIKADIYCLLNSDVEVTANWLLPIVDLFKKDAKVAVAQPKILDYYNRTSFEYAGAAGGFIDRLAYPFCRGRIFQEIEEDSGQYDDTSEIFWATGACMFISSKVFWEIGGFDDDYFAHQEEIDLCWRIKRNDYKVMYSPMSNVYHMGGSTLSNMNPKKTFLNFRNSLFNILKNTSKYRWPLLIGCRLLLDGIAGVRFLLEKKPRHCIAIIRAHFSFYTHFFKIKSKRKGPFPKLIYKSNSIVFDFFVKKHKTFLDLRE